jgi:hypothetical protein
MRMGFENVGNGAETIEKYVENFGTFSRDGKRREMMWNWRMSNQKTGIIPREPWEFRRTDKSMPL